MKLTTASRDLAEAVAFASRFSPKRPTLPILSGIRLGAEGGDLHLSVFDYEQAAATAIEADTATEGVALVSAALLTQITAKLPQAYVHLETEDRTLKLRCGTVRASLPLMPVEEYPKPDFEAEMLARISGAVFEDTIQRVALAAGVDEDKQVLHGVHTIVGAGGVTFMATDRYRVAHLTITCETGAEASLTIPAVVFRDAAKLLGSSETVELGITATGMVTMRGDRGTVLSRVLAGNYPPLERLFPKNSTASAVVNREVATDATLRGALVAEDKGAVKFTFTEGECRMEGASEGKGVTEEFEAEYSDRELTVSLRPQFMVDGLTACRAERVRLDFTHEPGATKPGPVLFSGGDGFRYLLQPNLLLR